MKIKNIIMFFLLLLLAVSCSSKQTPVDRLTRLDEKLDKVDAKYTEEEWAALGEEFDEIEEEISKYKDQYTDEELREIGRLRGRCMGKLAKKAVRELGNEIRTFIKESDGLIEGFMEVLQDRK